jgi:acetoin:2,6-dichlorophenolindophenol oxidoreductase subunit alpha
MPTDADFFRQMIRLRHLENALTELSAAGQLRGSLHLCQGQEACPAGACAALRKDDALTATYRGHGYVLAKGTSLDAVVAEILGRATGLCKGKGGKMHLFDPEFGVLGTNGIVGAGVGTACGAALASKLSKSDRIALTVFGDGAINQGHLMECWNMGVLYKLPVIFFCENNLYSEMTPLTRSHGNRNITERAAGFGIPTEITDGNDPQAVFDSVSTAAERARSGEGPTLIEALTYRTTGHYQADPGTSYRTKEEVEEWRGRSPIERLRTSLESQAEQIDGEELKLVAEAVKKALAAPVPSVNEATTEVFA